MQIPVLHAARLDLVAPSDDAEALYESFYTDADASAAYGGPLTADAARARLDSDIGAWHAAGFGVWVLRRRAETDLVGVCGYWQGKGWPIELTWWLLPRARGHGFAEEASRVAIHHAYRTFGWPSVETYMNDANEPARRLALRLGGAMIDRRTFPDGVERDVFRIPDPSRQTKDQGGSPLSQG